MAKVDPKTISAALQKDDRKLAAKLLGEHCGHEWVQHYLGVIAAYKRHRAEKDLTLEKLYRYMEPYFQETKNENYVAKRMLWLDRAQSLKLDDDKLDEMDEFWIAFKKASDEPFEPVPPAKG